MILCLMSLRLITMKTMGRSYFPIEGFDETVHEIYSIVIDNENEIEITTLNNGISISVPLFIEFIFRF